ncbi:multicopper oxidase, partial [Rhizoctonia solani AG-3 Rhs1AP]
MDRHSSAEGNDVGFLEVLYKDPDSNSSEQRYKRLHQWRPLSWNPFDVQDQDGMAREDEEYQHLLEQSPTSPQPTSLNTPVAMHKTESNQLLNPGPAWVNLFYDLAWTATFSSLTQNGQFDTVWDTLSYTAFFVVVWWLWASQPSEIATLDPKVYFSYPNGTLVDIIFTVTAGNPATHPSHPMHKHGVKAWLLGSGTGAFPYATIDAAVSAGYSGINIKNPPLRDDFPTPGALTGKVWMAIRFRAVDPGPVILHCHIDLHLATGMAIVLLEGADEITRDNIPSYYLNWKKS